MQRYKSLFKPGLLSLAITGTIYSTHANAQDPKTLKVKKTTVAEAPEEVLVIGSRRLQPRSSAESPVPVDFISNDELDSVGNGADLTDNLKALVPSYSAAPATGDGSAFVRPTSLRGMSPDQTLVLVNGKRRHRSALVQFFAPAAGNGSHSPDVAMIPSIALQNIQVLRDGAAAQYGSDAIAGVMNFELKDASEGGEFQVQYGEFFEGESSVKLAGNIGLELGDNGFANISVEHVDNEALSRGNQRPDAQDLIDAGVQNVGADTPFDDAPLVQTWGRPETSGTRLFINSGLDIGTESKLYAFGNYAQTDGRYRFFYRPADHSTITDLNLQSQYPAGYTPYLDGAQTDFSLVTGFEGKFTEATGFDFSVGIGSNEIDYFLNNSLNSSLPLKEDGTPITDFDVGAYKQEEISINADFSTELTDSLFFAYGAEWRQESFTLYSGDSNASTGSGPSGFTPPSEESAGTFDRDNVAIYGDIEQDITENWLVQYALRFEDFSDFGGTANWKLASRYLMGDGFTLRGAASTGFHAPTPGQANISSIITTFDGVTGQQNEEGLVPANSQAARNAGGTELKEEEALNLSLGFAAELGEDWGLTVDFYRIEVDDRIYRTGDIPIPNVEGKTLSFYTNALDLEHQGFDILLSGNIYWASEIETQLTFAYAHNEIDVTDQKLVAGTPPVSEAIVEDIENNYPEDKFTLSTFTDFNNSLQLLVRATYYGAHYDERGRIDGSAGNRSAEIDPVVYVDVELNWDVNDNIRLTAGGANIFDTYVDEIEDDGVYANRQSVGLPYPRRTVANYEGGSLYLKAAYRF